MSGGRELNYKSVQKLNTGSAAALTDLIPALQGNEVRSLTLTQISALLNTTLGAAITATTLSAMTFTTTGATDGAIAAITSASSSWGLAYKGELEFLIETVKENKAAIAEIRAL
jgi:hypothetical protein